MQADNHRATNPSGWTCRVEKWSEQAWFGLPYWGLVESVEEGSKVGSKVREGPREDTDWGGGFYIVSAQVGCLWLYHT